MSNDNLKNKTKKGFFWSTIERFSSQGIQFVFAILIARILTPEDYGIVAMPLIFLALAQVFIDSGFSNALVRKPDLREEDLSTAFYFNIMVGIVCYGVLFFASPWIADFYQTPILANLLKFTALSTLFNPLCAVQQAVLTKEIDFKSQAKVTVSAAIISGIVGLYLASTGFGVWALVFQQVSSSLIRTVALWIVSKWRPKTGWSRESFRYLWGYGSKIMGVGILDTVFNNIYPLVIGKFYTAKDLGDYTRAQQFVDLPINNVTGILQRVSFPVLSSIQNQDERLRANYLRMLRTTAFIMFPLMLGIAVLAKPLVLVFLGEKWLGCVLLLQILCVAKIWTPINAVNLNLLQVKGRSDIFLRLELIKKAIIVLTMIVTIPRGIVWMVSGTVFTTFIAFIINTLATKRLANVDLLMQVKEFIPTLAITLIMASIVYIFNCLVNNIYVQLFGGFAIGVTTYAFCAFSFKLKALTDVLQFIKKS